MLHAANFTYDISCLCREPRCWGCTDDYFVREPVFLIITTGKLIFPKNMLAILAKYINLLTVLQCLFSLGNMLKEK